MSLDGFVVEETTFGSVTLLLLVDGNPFQGTFVGDHVDELAKWDLDKVLIVLLPQIGVLFPVFVVTDDDAGNVVGNELIHQVGTRFLKVIVHFVRPFSPKTIGSFTLLFVVTDL